MAIKGLATAFQLLMTPFYSIVSALRAITEAVIGVNVAFNEMTSGNFKAAGDRLAESGAKINKIYQDNQAMTNGALKDIWTDKMEVGDLKYKDRPQMSSSLFGEKTTQQVSGSSKSKELEKASTNISGSAPRNTTIQINSLIGQNNNYISNVSDPYKDLSTFMEKLKQALAQEIVDVNIQVG